MSVRKFTVTVVPEEAIKANEEYVVEQPGIAQRGETKVHAVASGGSEGVFLRLY